jgi:hypothetical protein
LAADIVHAWRIYRLDISGVAVGCTCWSRRRRFIIYPQSLSGCIICGGINTNLSDKKFAV